VACSLKRANLLNFFGVYLMVSNLVIAMTVAGSDSGGGAGIQADLKTFAALGVHGVSVITSVTAQNTKSVDAVQDISIEVILAQLRSIKADIGFHAVKTGMLHTSEIIEAISYELKGSLLCVDPVMVSKSGHKLLKDEAVRSLKESLLPLAYVVTPNAEEARVLSGVKVTDLESAKVAAKAIAQLGCKAVVVKGGHFGERAVDTLYFNDEFYHFESERVQTKTDHGTGCVFSAAITACLAKGMDLIQAVNEAKKLVTAAIKHGFKIGEGHGPVNPMFLLYQESQRYQALLSLEKAISELESLKGFGVLIPESQTNFVYALEGASEISDVLGVPGRIVRFKDDAKAVWAPRFGASKHVANLVLTAQKFDESVRSAINLAYSQKILSIVRGLGYSVSFFDRAEEPADVARVEGRSMIWGTEVAIKTLGRVPDVIVDKGGFGKEPMIFVLGKDPKDVLEKTKKIFQALKAG
jgi:hydroxymethylpyrimidine kinase/phosphomethylpyrimidine kinase